MVKATLSDDAFPPLGAAPQMKATKSVPGKPVVKSAGSSAVHNGDTSVHEETTKEVPAGLVEKMEALRAQGYSTEGQKEQLIHNKTEDIRDFVQKCTLDDRAPSLSEIKMVDRAWNESRLQHGAELMRKGVGLKKAAQEAQVQQGHLKDYFEQYYCDCGSDSDSD